MEEKVFLVKDLSGRGYSCEYSLEDLASLEDTELDDESLEYTIMDFGETAEIGDEYNEIHAMKIIRIK